MKSAKAMFEDLGYVYQESYFEGKLDKINYLKNGNYTPQIAFDVKNKCIIVYRQGKKTSWFDETILQAINKQIKELNQK